MEKLNKELLATVSENDVNAIKKYIALGADVNFVDQEGETALHKAAPKGIVQIIQLLLDSGCNPFQKNHKGETVLHQAAYQRNTDAMKLFLENGCNPRQTDNKGRTALHYTAATNDDATVKLLLKSGFKPNQKDDQGRTALHAAADTLYVNPDIIRIFLNNGCNPNKKDKEGMTPSDLLSKAFSLAYTSREREKAKEILKEYEEYWHLGLPLEVKEIDNKSAKIFASLLKEEGYHHYEARVMLAGEQGTGKTTIARYLVGEGPTRVRISTDGIDLYNGLCFINHEDEEWLNGAQDFTLLEVTISRSLRQNESTSAKVEESGLPADQDVNIPDRQANPQLEYTSSTADESAKRSPFTPHIKTEDQLLLNGSVSEDQSISNSAVNTKLENKEGIKRSPVLQDKSFEESLQRNYTGTTTMPGVCETIPDRPTENDISTSNASVHTKVKEEFSNSVGKDSETNIRTSESSQTTEVKNPGIIGKLKKLFGVKKDVDQIKVSVTKGTFFKETLKVAKKKLNQKKIAPVIIWDFGGQDVFYSTHQTFLTYRAIYMIVLDGSRSLDDPSQYDQYLPGKGGIKTARDYLRFWINTIVTYCKGSGPGYPRIMIVLTHKDKLEAIEVEPRRQQLFHDIEKMFSEGSLLSHLVIIDQIFVNARNKLDPEMAKIKKIIIEQAMQQPTWGQELPKCFIPLELEFDSLLNRNIPLITMEHMRRINLLQPVRPLTEEELKVFLKFQHSVGRIIYFEEAKLDEHIIIAPTHLIDAFRSIVTDKRFCEGDRLRQDSWDLMSKKGIIGKRSIDDIWKKKKYKKFQDHKEFLLGVMAHLDILVEPRRYDTSHRRIPADFFYVASMVRTSDETGYFRSPTFEQRNIAIVFKPSSSMIPPALSFRFISYCLSILAVKQYGKNHDEMLFHMSAVFTVDPSLDMCVNCDDELIVVRLVHVRSRTLIMRDLASSIKECLAVALEKICQLYVKTSSTGSVSNKNSFQPIVCCSSSDDPCLLPMLKLQEHDDSWICPNHGIEHTQDMLSSWNTRKVDIQCGIACPVTDNEFLTQIPSDIHLRRLAMQYSINETKELVIHLGLQRTTLEDMYVTYSEEPERFKFETLRRCLSGSNITFDGIRKAAGDGQIQNQHTLCKVVRGNPLDLDQEPAKWELVPTEEHLDRMAPLVGNNSLSFLVELGMGFQTWEQIKYQQKERDLVKLNRDILQEWKSEFCSLYNIRPSLRHVAQAFNNIGTNLRTIENVLADLF